MKNLMGGAGFLDTFLFDSPYGSNMSWIVEGVILWAYCILTVGSQRVLQESSRFEGPSDQEQDGEACEEDPSQEFLHNQFLSGPTAVFHCTRIF